MKMVRKQEKLLSTSIDNNWDIHESLTGESCPLCGYPIVMEEGLEVCYCCGWYKGMEDNDTNF